MTSRVQEIHAMNPKRLFQKGFDFSNFFFHFMSLVQVMLTNIRVLFFLFFFFSIFKPVSHALFDTEGAFGWRGLPQEGKAGQRA